MKGKHYIKKLLARNYNTYFGEMGVKDLKKEPLSIKVNSPQKRLNQKRALSSWTA